ncbi:MAG TPA: UDP-3-O-(3-hydroxymyristoyl)glucosamine N-acyltransferase [Planctomycetota bacterium]|nr:UDP-3-O-(3-hydroxymyristoyl)glucosamine N-acyltransferase [Planctomycetota bacterium]
MNLTLGDLAARIGAEIVRGSAQLTLCGVSNLEDAGPAQLAPFTDVNYLTRLKLARAGAILSKRGVDCSGAPRAAALLICDDPEIAFLDALRIFNPPIPRAPGIHPTAIVEDGVELGTDVHIGPRVFVERGSRIGARCVILANTVIGPDCMLGDDCFVNPNVTLYPRCKLGNRVILHSGAVLGADGFGYKFRGGRYVKVPHAGSVELGDDVEVGANSCIDCGALGPTRIGEGTKIDNLVQIAHNNTVGKHCILCAQTGIAGSCTLEDYVTLGGNVGLADHSYIGKGARAGAKAGIAGRVEAGHDVWGVLARDKRQVLRSQALTLRLPELVERIKALEKRADISKSTPEIED